MPIGQNTLLEIKTKMDLIKLILCLLSILLVLLGPGPHAARRQRAVRIRSSDDGRMSCRSSDLDKRVAAVAVRRGGRYRTAQRFVVILLNPVLKQRICL